MMPDEMAGITARIAARIGGRTGGIDAAAWDACFPGEAESHAYYSACEAAGARAPHPAPIETCALVIEGAGGVLALAPLFRLDFRLDTALQGTWRKLGDGLARAAPRLLCLKVLGIGSPYAERAHLGFAPGLDDATRQAARRAMIAAIEVEAGARGIGLLAWKDLAPQDAEAFAPELARAGFARLGSLPVAVLDLPFADEAAYLASLSAATRKDIRRKLAGAGAVRIERRTSIAGLEAEIDALYTQTRLQSGLDYGDLETLPPGYFDHVSRNLGERAVFMLYWVGDTLAAFNLLLLEPTRVIDKFLGMRYPLAREHNLYAVSWMNNIRYCLETGIPRLQTGQTAYAAKLRFGSRLVPSVVYFRHRNPVLNRLLRFLSPWLAFESADPDLRTLRAAGKIA